jgi:hypothetical protein
MDIEVEVNMKIPSLTVKATHEPDKKLDNSGVRFTKRISVPAIPKPGTTLELSMSGEPFECVVTRSDWHEERSIFIISCSYSKRSITIGEYDALVNGSDWQMKQLL